MKRFLIIGGIFLVFIVAGFYVVNTYIYNQKQESTPIEAYRGTLTGEYVCLPHKNQNGPQTLECAFGMKTDAGEYYAVDFGPTSQSVADLRVGERFKANGLITPTELLSTDQWQKYNVEGIFSVTDSIEKL